MGACQVDMGPRTGRSDHCAPGESREGLKRAKSSWGWFLDPSRRSVWTLAQTVKEKSTVLAAFQRFLSDHSAFLPNGVGEFWTDGGGEYCNSDMDQFCEEILRSMC